MVIDAQRRLLNPHSFPFQRHKHQVLSRACRGLEGCAAVALQQPSPLMGMSEPTFHSSPSSPCPVTKPGSEGTERPASGSPSIRSLSCFGLRVSGVPFFLPPPQCASKQVVPVLTELERSSPTSVSPCAVVFHTQIKGRSRACWGKKPIVWERAVIIIHSRKRPGKWSVFRGGKSWHLSYSQIHWPGHKPSWKAPTLCIQAQGLGLGGAW